MSIIRDRFDDPFLARKTSSQLKVPKAAVQCAVQVFSLIPAVSSAAGDLAAAAAVVRVPYCNGPPS